MFSKLTKVFSILVSVLFILGFTSCDNDLNNVKLIVNGNELKQGGGNMWIEVQAANEWSLELVFPTNDSWANLSKESGEGSKANILLSYDENTVEENRFLDVRLISDGEEDFIRLNQRGKSAVVPDKVSNWLELPATYDDERTFYYHHMSRGGVRFRNYSFDWVPNARLALWVAYPVNAWAIGSGGRTDDWDYDPKVPRNEQAVLHRGYSGSGRYDRGHQIPSADRLERSSNLQTFYYTNSTPQMPDLNQKMWANLEMSLRDWARASDTLYVVTGCTIEGSTKYALDNEGNQCLVPTGYYKAVLRYAKSSDVGFSGYTGMAIYFDHKGYSGSVPKSMGISIKELEDKIGVDLYVNLPAKVGESVARNIESQDPQKVDFWWN